MSQKTRKFFDHCDRRILRTLQDAPELSQRELGARVGLSANACWHRVQALKKKGFLLGFQARLSRRALRLDLAVFVMVRTRHHSREWLEQFKRHVESIDEVVNFYRISGNYDYLLHIVTCNMSSFDQVYQRLINAVELDAVTSYFAIEEIAGDRPLPLGHL